MITQNVRLARTLTRYALCTEKGRGRKNCHGRKHANCGNPQYPARIRKSPYLTLHTVSRKSFSCAPLWGAWWERCGLLLLMVGGFYYGLHSAANVSQPQDKRPGLRYRAVAFSPYHVDPIGLDPPVFKAAAVGVYICAK